MKNCPSAPGRQDVLSLEPSSVPAIWKQKACVTRLLLWKGSFSQIRCTTPTDPDRAHSPFLLFQFWATTLSILPCLYTGYIRTQMTSTLKMGAECSSQMIKSTIKAYVVSQPRKLQSGPLEVNFFKYCNVKICGLKQYFILYLLTIQKEC